METAFADVLLSRFLSFVTSQRCAQPHIEALVFRLAGLSCRRYRGQGEFGPIIQFNLVPAAGAVYNNKVSTLRPTV